MRIRRKQIEAFGFVGSGMYKQAAYQHMYYRKDVNNCCVQMILNGEPDQTLAVFRLTPEQMCKFVAGKLSLIPPGSCNPPPTGRAAVGDPEILFKGRVKSLAHLMKVFGMEIMLRRHRVAERQAKKKPFT